VFLSYRLHIQSLVLELMSSSTASSQGIPRATLLRLQNELRELRTNPDSGFIIFPPTEQNLLIWKVAIFGAPDTVYQGGYFVAHLEFPVDYPFSPPKFIFSRPPLHPNIYSNGHVCVSILHSSTNTVLSGEDDNERWNITQTVRTILVSIVSLLSAPNLSSPANVDASTMYKDWKNNKSNEYAEIIGRQVRESQADAAADGVVVPLTQEQYLKPAAQNQADVTANNNENDDATDDVHFFDDE